jgi:BirA family biotin operon repressor/biotin-[acetyl-CoA-carboxylase] ligase
MTREPSSRLGRRIGKVIDLATTVQRRRTHNGQVDTETSRLPLDPTIADRLPPPWRLRVVPETGSTNADLLALAATGEAEGAVEATEFQNAGRGRMDRSWTSPQGAGLTFSILLRPRPEAASWGWLALLAGLALRGAVGSDAMLKWPNDVLLGPDGLKVAGILAQATTGAAVIGIGLNVSTTPDELPVPTATSLAAQGLNRLDRGDLLGEFLGHFDSLYARWQAHDGDAAAAGLLAEYRAACVTLGRPVTVALAGGEVRGTAVDVDGSGRLLVRTDHDAQPVAVAAGDVTHVRPDSG